MQLVSVRLELDGVWNNYEPFCKILCQIDAACDGEGMFECSAISEDVLIFHDLTSMDMSKPNYIKIQCCCETCCH